MYRVILKGAAGESVTATVEKKLPECSVPAVKKFLPKLPKISSQSSTCRPSSVDQTAITAKSSLAEEFRSFKPNRKKMQHTFTQQKIHVVVSAIPYS